MTPLNISPQRLAQDFDVNETTIRQILNGQRRISKSMAHKLHMRFKTTTQFWLDAQNRHDRQKLEHWEHITRQA